jgi:hypothetical protein
MTARLIIMSHATTLPSNSFPVECQETLTRLIITSHSSVVTTDFVANLPSWQQSLLDQLTTEHSHREILEMLQASTKPRGPVSGTLINSFRSKADALLSVLVYLNLLADHFMPSISTIKICIYTNSESNVKRIIQN